MGRPEAKIENYLRRRVKETGGQYRKVKWISRRGAPDDLVWWTWPQAALVECKAEGKDVEPGSQQEREIQRFVDSGWPVYVVNSHADVDAMIEDVLGA
jgi:predicted alpha-1,6-mannanase (GH76 family)